MIDETSNVSSFLLSVSTAIQFIRLFYIMIYRHLTTDKHLSMHWQIFFFLFLIIRRLFLSWFFFFLLENENEIENKDQMIIDTFENSIDHIELIKKKKEKKEKLKYLWNCFINIDNWDIEMRRITYFSVTLVSIHFLQ